MISIDEQIAYAQQLVNDGKYPEYTKGILASLQRLKKIDDVQVPEEPEWLKYYRTEVECGNLKDYKQFINQIDTLRDLLKRESSNG